MFTLSMGKHVFTNILGNNSNHLRLFRRPKFKDNKQIIKETVKLLKIVIFKNLSSEYRRERYL